MVDPDYEELKKKMGKPRGKGPASNQRGKRRILIYRLRKEGYSIEQVSRALGIPTSLVTSHTSICNQAISIYKMLKAEGLVD